MNNDFRYFSARVVRYDNSHKIELIQGSALLFASSNKCYAFTAWHCVASKDIDGKNTRLEIDLNHTMIQIFPEVGEKELDVIHLVDSNETADWVLFEITMPTVEFDYTRIKLSCNIGFFPTKSFAFPKHIGKNGIILESRRANFSDYWEVEVITRDFADDIKGTSGAGLIQTEGQKFHCVGIYDETLEGGAFNNIRAISPSVLKGLIDPNCFENIPLNPIAEDIRLTSDTYFKTIHSEIPFDKSCIKINRIDQKDEILKVISKRKDLLIYGSAGSGKTAVVKDVYENLKETIVTYIIKATKLNIKDTREVFCMTENHTLVDINASFSAQQPKLLIVDSAEKLLDIEDTEILKLLFSSLHNHGWIFLFTARTNYLEELTILLHTTFSIDCTRVAIPNLSIEELKQIGKIFGIGLPIDGNLLQQLCIPFYLSHYISLYTNGGNPNTCFEFREKMWNTSIRGSIRIKQTAREQCLKIIAEKKCNSGHFYVLKSDIDTETAQLLIEDEILGEDRYGYFITHDIYEEWALVRIIDEIYYHNSKLINFFAIISSALPMRRAFRKWISEQIESQKPFVMDFVLMACKKDELQSYWGDEIFVSILQSEYASTFFKNHCNELKNDDWNLFIRIASLLQITCQTIKEFIRYKGEEYPRMTPFGQGWNNIVNFICNEPNLVDSKTSTVISVLNKYSSHQYKSKDIASRAAQLIFDLFKQEEIEGIGHYRTGNKQSYILVIQYISYLTNQLKGLINEIIDNKWFEVRQPYFEFCKYILTDINAGLQFARLLPNELIAISENIWVSHPKPQKEDDDFPWGYNQRGVSSMYNQAEYIYGLKDDVHEFEYFPSSPLKTPILSLLILFPEKTISFICRFVNLCVKKSTSSHHWQSNGFTTKLFLLEGSHREVYASDELWCMYRWNNGYMPNLLFCLLSALEKYLLEKNQDSNAIIRILQETNNVALISVVASVCLSDPDKYFDILCALCKQIDFLQLDLTRKVQEYNSGSTLIGQMDCDMAIERKESNELSHRKISLEDFLQQYQIKLREIEQTEEVFVKRQKLIAVIEQIRQDVSLSAYKRNFSQFILAKVDVENMKITPQIYNGVPATLYEPNLSEELKQVSKQTEKDSEYSLRYIQLEMWVCKRNEMKGEELTNNKYEQNPKKAYEEIVDFIFKKEELLKNKPMMIGNPNLVGLVCSVMIKDFPHYLDNSEVIFCKNQIIKALELSLSPIYKPEIIYDTIPTLMKVFPETESFITQVVIDTLSLHHRIGAYNSPCEIISKSLLNAILWETHEDFMYSLIIKIISSHRVTDISDLSIEGALSLLMLLPNNTTNPKLINYALKCISILSCLLIENPKRNDKDLDLTFDAFNKISIFIINHENVLIETLMLPLLPHIAHTNKTNELLELFLLQGTIPKNHDSFWHIWHILWNPIAQAKYISFHTNTMSTYLLNPCFLREDSHDWFYLEDKDLDFFIEITNNSSLNFKLTNKK